MDIYIADDLLTDMNDAALSARQGMLIGQRLDAIEEVLDTLTGGSSYVTATTGEIDAIFAA